MGDHGHPCASGGLCPADACPYDSCPRPCRCRPCKCPRHRKLDEQARQASADVKAHVTAAGARTFRYLSDEVPNARIELVHGPAHDELPLTRRTPVAEALFTLEPTPQPQESTRVYPD